MRHHAKIKDHTSIFSILCWHWGGTLISLQNHNTFRSLDLDSMSSPLAPKTNVDTNINVKNRTRRCAIHLRGFSFAQHPILKFRGQGDTHRVKMKSKASSQQPEYWRSSCWMANCLWVRWTCHSLSNIEVCANASGNISKHQPARKRLKKSTLAASTLACCVSIRTNLKHTRNTRPIRQFTMAGTLQVAKLWHAGFSYVQTSSKPCSNLKSMGLDHASRWRQYFKGKFN